MPPMFKSSLKSALLVAAVAEGTTSDSINSLSFLHSRISQKSSSQAIPEPPAKESRFTSWSYLYHGQDWGLGQCNRRQRQSPIDFDFTAPWAFGNQLLRAGESIPDYWVRNSFYFNYQPMDKEISAEYGNNGHALSVNIAGNGIGGITFEKGWFNLMSIVLHMKSEHTFYGEHTPIELHFVHKRYDSEQMVVVAIPVIFEKKADGVASNGALTALMQVFKDNIPKKLDGKFVEFMGRPGTFKTKFEPKEAPVLLNDLMGTGTEFFRYHGGYTVPPCTETVEWMVKKEPVVLADAFSTKMFNHIIMVNTAGNGNYRSTMPRAGRPISLVKGIMGEPVSEGEKHPIVSKVTTRGFKGISYGKQAYNAGTDDINSAHDFGWAVIKTNARLGKSQEAEHGLDHYVPGPTDINFGKPTPLSAKDLVAHLNPDPVLTPQQQVEAAERVLKVHAEAAAKAEKAKAAQEIKTNSGYGPEVLETV